MEEIEKKLLEKRKKRDRKLIMGIRELKKELDSMQKKRISQTKICQYQRRSFKV